MKLETGERIYLPLDEDGLPVFYPTYFVSRMLRSKTINTQKNQLQELRLLSRWESESKISVEDRFKQGQSLTESEIMSLVDFCGFSLGTVRKLESGVSLMRDAYGYVNSNVKRMRLTVIRNYLEFLCKQVSTDPNRGVEAKKLASALKSYTPKGRNHFVHKEEKKLTEDQIEVVEKHLLPGSPENPFKSDALQLRNMLMLHLMFETGVRLGELMGLHVEDIDVYESLLKIRRRHHDPRDPRKHQPLAKTKERDIPIPSDLAELIEFYLSEFRGRIKAARRHPILFVGHHKKGEGEPLSLEGANYVMKKIREAFPVMASVHPHLMRHHMNYRFSKMLENIEGWDEMTPEEKANFDSQTRANLMGWSENSSMQQYYNRRYNRELMESAMRKRAKLQSGISKGVERR
ncbi:tyrosine-type recombinase/integrase [Marinobacter nauticus]|uniref:tyrosine-type recombinase/integrase n=1 Tax=Marinobacter nauticus TaxID=2743 RepID=UPI000F21BA11|nr:site-specific integrase [Marinobacter nauticus]RKR70996.1 phage integrase family protein [Marinobacter nauticus]